MNVLQIIKAFLQNINVKQESLQIFVAFAALMLISIFIAIATEFYFIAALPAALLVGYIAIVDFRFLFYILLASIPISTEIDPVNGFATDFPTEPLIVGLMFIYLFYLLFHSKTTKRDFLLNPITLVIIVHWVWIFYAMINSNLFLVSLKYFLAKSWYIIVFVFLAGHILKDEKAIKRLVWAVAIPFVFAVIIILIRHYLEYNMSFENVNDVMAPFFRNHVNYAALLAVFFPFVWYATTWYKRFSFPWLFLAFSSLLLLVAIQFSYTRTAYVALIIAAGAYFVIRWRLVKLVVLLSVIGGFLLVMALAHDNQFLEFAPDYEQTVTHTNFDNLVEATTQLEDISTMERVYRWVAASRMTGEELFTGYGPGNFYNFYKPYTLNMFETYVSDNPEQSGVHNYFLMTLIEQGLPGLIIFLVLTFFVLIRAEDIYHATTSIADRRILLMATLSIIIIDAFLLMNDMIETDKLGSFFFINLAIIINMDLKRKFTETQRHGDTELS